MSRSFKNFEKVFNKILIGVLASIIILSLIAVLSKQKVELKDTTKLEIHFKEIVQAKIEGKISYYYDLYNQDNNEIYRIAANNVDCFDINRFVQNVNAGNLIKIYIDDQGLTKPSVIGIIADGKNYIDTNCVNRKIDSDKVFIPIIFIIPAMLIGIVYYLKKRKSKKV
jgi:hypothetical protein